MTSYLRRYDVMTSHRRLYDVILAQFAQWDVTTSEEADKKAQNCLTSNNDGRHRGGPTHLNICIDFKWQCVFRIKIFSFILSHFISK